VANSQWVANQAAVSGVLRDSITVVHEGVEVPPPFTVEQREEARRRWGIAPRAPLLGCVGVLLPDKGQEWLIRALAVLRKEFADARLLLAGDGPCRGALEKLAHELGLSEAVVFAGFVKDVESVYAALDIFLLPSFFEALNNSLLAAMAHETPCVAFNRGALGEIIEDGKSGILVSGRDAGEISAAAIRILRDSDLARRFAQAGRQRVMENFSAERMVKEMIRVYEEAVTGAQIFRSAKAAEL
jgi:glycosyltransferase involved in cell wall biosynthesis